MIKYLFIFLSIVIHFGCLISQSESNDLEKIDNILPIEFMIKGRLPQIQDIGGSIPNIYFIVDSNHINIRVGVSEFFQLKYKDTELPEILKHFSLSDFRYNKFYYNPEFQYMGYLESSKTIDNTLFKRKFSNYKRSDIEINYLSLNKEETDKFSKLSNSLNRLAIQVLKDDVDKGSMISAKSITEALKNPEIVYELMLKNSRASSLIGLGKLTNLRVLDISGSNIRRIPTEIEHCVHLKTIIANASQLSKIPASISKLKKLRFINFGFCQIKELPQGFGQLESLWTLMLGSNQLTNLPKSIHQLKNVTFFALGNNKFKNFPKEVLGLESVRNLWMHGNQFKYIPLEITQLKNMSHFLVDVHEIENMQDIVLPKVRVIDETIRGK